MPMLSLVATIKDNIATITTLDIQRSGLSHGRSQAIKRSVQIYHKLDAHKNTTIAMKLNGIEYKYK